MFTISQIGNELVLLSTINASFWSKTADIMGTEVW